MTLRRTFAVIALASSLVLPTLASSAIVQKWASPPSTYLWVPQVTGDINQDGTVEMATMELQSGGVAKIGVRSGSSGALLAQTVGTYAPAQFWIQSMDSNGFYDIIFSDTPTGNLNCVHYTAGSGTLSVRFSFKPTPNGVPSEWKFADLDGNGHLYMVFKDEASLSNNYYVYDSNGVLVATLNPSGAPSGSGWTRQLYIDDYDADGRQEILIRYHSSSAGSKDYLYVYESNAPGPTQPAANRSPGIPGAAQLDGRGSLATSQRSGLARRQVEPVYVDGSR